jgi:hypothetical protein
VTATINETSFATASGSALSEAATSIALIPIIVVIVLLALKEILRAFGGPNWRRAVTGLDVAIVPLAAAATAIVLVRLLTIVDRI